MAEKIRRFIPRAPRYVLRPSDQNVMRFGLSGLQGPAHTEQTMLLNLSESGAAFLAPVGCELKIGDIIKVEIPIPNDDQIAWFGRVVRIEEHRRRSWYFSPRNEDPTDHLLVGLKFEKLPEGHTRRIRRGIEESFLRSLKEYQSLRLLYYKTYVIQNIIPILFYVLVGLAAFGFLYYFSLPDASYDKNKGAPWGQRFKF